MEEEFSLQCEQLFLEAGDISLILWKSNLIGNQWEWTWRDVNTLCPAPGKSSKCLQYVTMRLSMSDWTLARLGRIERLNFDCKIETDAFFIT